MDELEALQAQIANTARKIEQMEVQLAKIRQRSNHIAKSVAATYTAVSLLEPQIEANRKMLNALKQLYQDSKIQQERRIDKLEARLAKLESSDEPN